MITTYAQLIQELDECIVLWHGCDYNQSCASFEFAAFRAIVQYAIHKGLDYDIGSYKLSFILSDDGEIE